MDLRDRQLKPKIYEPIYIIVVIMQIAMKGSTSFFARRLIMKSTWTETRCAGQFLARPRLRSRACS